MAPHQSPDIKLAEVLKLAVDLLLADPGPPLDGDNEDGRADTGVIDLPPYIFFFIQKNMEVKFL